MPNEPTNTKQSNRLVVRFGDELLEFGFTALPNILIRHQGKLSISPEEFNFIIQIWYHWWDESDPYPSLRSVAERMHYDSVRSYSRSLQKKGHLLVRDRKAKGRGQLTSEYDFSPLIEHLKEVGREERAQRLARDVDWEVMPREEKQTPREDSHRGGVSQFTPNKTQENKTQLEEDSEYSNSFELQTQVFNGVSTFQNSKNEIEFFENDESKDEASGDEPQEQRRGDYQPITPSTNSFTTVGEVLKGRKTGSGRKPAAKSSETASETASSARAGVRQGRAKAGLPEPPAWLVEHITRLSHELHDPTHAEGNIGQAHNLFLFTGAEERRFQDRLSEAKRLTLKYDIEKKAEGEAGEWGQRNKMPYFFKVLRDQLGLKDVPASETKPVRVTRSGRGQKVNEDFLGTKSERGLS
jgi:hypothetical protein